MKTNKVLSSLIALFAGLVFFVPGHALAAAFGISPPWIENSNLKAGSNFVYIINLSANELSDDMMIQAEFSGDPEIAQWLTIRDQDKLLMPKGQNIVPMSVNVNIPTEAKTGKYEGNLRLLLKPTNGAADNIAILLGGNIAVNLTVVDHDVTDYWLQSISADPINEGEPVRLKATVKNLGNTELSKILTKASVLDMKTGKKLVAGSAEQLNQSIPPQAMLEAELSFAAPDLKMGDYWLDVEAFKDGKSVYANRLLLTVKPPLANNIIKTDVQVGEGWERPAAPEAVEKDSTPGVDIKTSVTVRAPLTNQLIAVVIGLLILLTGLVAKIYIYLKKRR